MERWKETRFAYEEKDARRTCYLSLEFLMGQGLSNAMLNLGITDAVTRVLYDYGIELEEVEDAEHDAGLGNGGLGRLVACFLDSCATLQLPVLGYGLRYEYGMFRQELDQRLPDRGTGSLAARRQPVGTGAPGIHPAHPLRRPHRVLQ